MSILVTRYYGLQFGDASAKLSLNSEMHSFICLVANIPKTILVDRTPAPPPHDREFVKEVNKTRKKGSWAGSARDIYLILKKHEYYPRI